MTLKELLGESYSETMTLADVDKALAGKKLADLSTGRYVDKDKYDKEVERANKIQKSFDEYKESTKEFETLKTENEQFKAEKKETETKATLKKYGIDEKYYKYVKSDIDDGTLKFGDDEKANKDTVSKYLKDNPSFALKGTTNRVVEIRRSTTSENTNKTNENDNKYVNDRIREAFGKPVNVG